MADEAEDLDLETEAGDETAAPEGEQTETTEPAPFDPEAVARIAGWAPKDQWKGDPADWKDADAFLIDTAAVNKTLRKKVKEFDRTLEKHGRITERLLASEVRRAKDEAKAELRAAVQAGDEDAAEAAANKLENVSAAPTAASSADEFAADHPWFGIHAEATGLAQVEAEKVFRKGGDAQAQFAAAEAAVRKRFAYLFEDAPAPARAEPRKEPPAVQGGQRTPRQPPRDAVTTLTAEERKAGEQFVRLSKGRMTLADYAKALREENA